MSKKLKYNFDERINRIDTDSIKWSSNYMKEYFGYGNLLPLWVADMDFRAPDTLINALKKRVEHGIFGYSIPPESYYQAIINWFKRRHNWEIDRKWLKFSPGVVPGICFLIQKFSDPGDKIIIQEPVYYPFTSSITYNGRVVSNNELVLGKGRYEMNFKDLEEKCKDPRTKMIILCSPHNPVGRVWLKEELKQLGEICIDNNILVVSDEIHCDLIFPGHKHIPFASISEKLANNSITCIAPSKTFNVAGLKSSNMIIPNKEIREDYTTLTFNISIRAPDIFGALATEVVYNECENWLEELLIYLKGNFEFLKAFFKKHLPAVKIFELEGTYLPWLDFRNLNIDLKELDMLIKKEAKVGLDDGAMFGTAGAGFQRINIACPRTLLQEALQKIVDVISSYNNERLKKK